MLMCKMEESDVFLGPPAGVAFPYYPKRHRIRTQRNTSNKHEREIIYNEKIKRVNELPNNYKELMLAKFPTDNQYELIYINPIYKLKPSESELGWTESELKTLPIDKIAATQCVCMIWVDCSTLEIGLNLLKHWGFNYETIFKTLLKRYRNGQPLLGAGPLTKPSIELLLVGAKAGTPYQKWKVRTVPEQQEYPATMTKYEYRPEVIKGLVRDFFCPLRRIEIFSNYQTEGYDVWGTPYRDFFKPKLRVSENEKLGPNIVVK